MTTVCEGGWWKKWEFEQSEVSKDVDGDYSQSCSERCQTLQVVFSFFSVSHLVTELSFPAVVMGRGSKQAVSQQKGIELWATINTLQHALQTFSAKTGNINHYRFAVHFNVFFWYEHIHPWFLFYFRDIINMCDKFPFWKAVSVKKGNWFVSWCTWIAKFISFHQRLDVDVLLWWGSKHQW